MAGDCGRLAIAGRFSMWWLCHSTRYGVRDPQGRPVADPKTYTQDEFDAMVSERDALKGKRDELLDEVKGMRRRLKEFDGLDAKEVRDLLDRAAEDDRKRAKDAGDWEKREGQLTEKHAKELQVERDARTAAEQSVERYVTDAEVLQAIGGKGSAKLLLPVIKPRVKVVKGDDGQLAVRVLDVDGSIRVKVEKGKAVPLTLTEYVTELRDDPDLAGAFAGSGASGSGASRSEGSGGAARTIPAGDDKGFLANLDKIAKGEVVVQS